MKSWSSPHLPHLPGRGGPVRLHDTASRELRPAGPGEDEDGRAAGLYVCGITPYDATHMGHASTYLAFDLLVRAWRDAGHRVQYVQNVTDVDEPLLERAAATGEDWRDLAVRETDLFREDMTALGVVPPDVYLGAVETVPRAAEAVRRLVAAGAAYSPEGSADVYFDVASDPRFGEVSGYDAATMARLFAERGGDPATPGKRSPLDPVLWRAEREGEPSWDGGDLGPGRPGWHVECVAIALDHLGVGFDVQGGGSDLVFPHHEMGASHGQVLTGDAPYARLYAHGGMVALDGEKMSKSRGNLVLVSTLRRAGEDPSAIRLAVLAHHYRSDWSWTDEGLATARERLDRWRAAVALPTGPDAGRVLDGVRSRLAADLDAPGALAVVDAWADAALAADPGAGSGSATAPGLVADVVDALLGVRLRRG
ncbi:cysteine--1-D-myo-inosityl 2-amino-2-deoxy-alpha-D-glucopyranoside ligase [Pseudokineococcus lusitanus]|uniref:L-cysteine:1D-myo-inositol 2-amino-2-deoxy-alpha-D-glucopyranoside ligase n=1 Tax=Pseudokineococcus lusitanus TaxID=763993 RepID=A0A3N1HSU3_9ACTN|nr:cysteine--1-D-myo-inosityl 2-amino-2-deoxy-alpha-D-glucopyranoside ligase [Pseudokineococcus lusitanus]ROP45490.1 L-cysteine:1D-myo-inositol 2-amino-2-deoxy-alpha-D-glucopyranoside ligase [Pseudokineococcus lusitanus]